MPNLKIRLKLNEGRLGVPLEKLAEVAKDMKLFLSMLTADLGIPNDEWIASNFSNGSVMFDCQRLGVDAKQYEQGQQALHSVITNDRSHVISALIRPATRLQYSQLAKRIDPDEIVKLGLYRDGELDPKNWYDFSREKAEQIQLEDSKKASYYGEIQGIVHSFYKEARRPHLVVRELATRALVCCYFKREMYNAAVETMNEADGVIFVEGDVIEDLGKGVVESISVADFRLAPRFDFAFYEAFIGSQPRLTGDSTSEEYIERLRTDA
jgi:hypothetical protein